MTVQASTILDELKKIALFKGGLCLSKEYFNSKTKLKWQCRYGHIWEAIPKSIKNGTWCPECAKLNRAKKNRSSIEEMHELARKRGGKCLSTEYTNNSTKLIWQCSEGHIWGAVPKSIKTGKWCAECSKKKKLTLDEMSKLAEKNAGKCLSKKYINVKSKLLWQCKNGHIWEATPDNIKRGTWCPYCANFIVSKKLKSNINEMHKLAKEKGGTCLSTEYVNANTKLIWQCSKGYIWEAIPSRIKSGAWCPECAKDRVAKSKIKFDISDMHDIAEVRGGKCLSSKYKSIKKKLKWQCSEGHIWDASYDNIKRGRWCPECSNGLGERICREFFEVIFNRKFPKSRPKWLKNKDGNQLELDGYCKSLKLAFEHQGRQHFKYHEKFHIRKEDYTRAIKNDEDKANICRKYDVTLICVPEIPALLPIYRVKEFIKKECEKDGRGIPNDFKNIDIDLKQIYTPDSKTNLGHIKKLAKEKDGFCLSSIFLGFSIALTFKCNNGHTFRLKPQLLINGLWCPFCHKQEAELKKMHLLAKSHSGKCLSNEYKNVNAKLEWQCSKGHIWSAIPKNAKIGKWCPKCARDKHRLTLSEMKILAKNQNGKCLSFEYINNNSKLKWQCSKGHVWEARASSIKSGHWCPICSSKVLTIQEMYKLAELRNGNCLSTEYINSNTELTWQCNKGHIWKTKPVNIKSGRWCPECAKLTRANKLRSNIDEMYKLANIKRGQCLSAEYINNRTKLKWRCECGHTWEAVPSSIKRGSWCPRCSKSNKYSKSQLTLL